MRKRLFLILVVTFFLYGCTNINETDIDTIISEVQSSKSRISNTYRTGYKYYLPGNLTVLKSSKSNEEIRCNDIVYYMYVDLISYYNKVVFNYKVKSDSYYSRDISYNNMPGYVEINVKNDKYLIEIMYNYAKIEVIVDKDNINEAVTNGLIILSSINYSEEIIKNLLEEDILNYSEENFELFDTDKNDSNFLDVVQEYDNYNEEIPDYDIIN